ncbi:chaperone modulator CbpM [Tenacibaculum sp. IB213877]|uniref:chaperone modulator CbpM n=1 Tax=Tenacibaculum sp. IB213877 TaxID=3097351 RepID=UPI002A5A3077|nr:chaperone modulator CbpM [Tenacibaculum sp. IB213877]MDY0780883.1 chaperone modulator CbpM [Tenacibaculum sp. IB213877]
MELKDYITIQQFCELYEVPTTFVNSLQDFELIEITVVNNNNYLKKSQLHLVERMIRLHYDLDINFEGIDAIHHLLNQVENLQNEVAVLKNRLNRYEDF